MLSLSAARPICRRVVVGPAPLDAPLDLGRAIQGAAEDVAEGLAGDQRGAAGDDVGAADFEEGVGLGKADRSAEVAEGEAADFLRFGVLDIDDPRCAAERSEEHTSELQSLMRISYAVFCLK